MNEILSGLLYINKQDIWAEYRAFLSEDNPGEYTNYSALLKPSTMKPYVAVSTREIDGEKLPQTLLPALEPRDIVLQFALCAANEFEFMGVHGKFIEMLRSGWLEMFVPQIERTFRLYYQGCSDYTQLTPFNGEMAAKIKVKFREPKPQF